MRKKTKLVAGVGVNDADYIVQPTIDGEVRRCPYLSAWNRMLARCYNEGIHKDRPTYKNVEVCSEWLLFSNFRDWMKRQDWRGKALDKDILRPGNKMYSPDTCCFVDAALNNLFTNQPKNPSRKFREKKSEDVLFLGLRQADPRIRDGLLRHADRILSGDQ